MNSQEFITGKLNLLVEKFPQVKATYEHDSLDSSHLIHILPSHIYKGDKSYIDFEKEFILEFIQKFPYETIAFISDGCLCEIEKPIYEAKGALFDSINFVEI